MSIMSFVVCVYIYCIILVFDHNIDTLRHYFAIQINIIRVLISVMFTFGTYVTFIILDFKHEHFEWI